MLQITNNIYSEGKMSLELLLRKQAFKEVQVALEEKDIDINNVIDEDIEKLVAAKTQDKMTDIKGFVKGTVFTLVLSSIIGF
jgi:hypothetical protein